MTLANWLTLLRILLIPFFVSAILYGNFLWALLLFGVAGLTDALDGYVARKTQVSTLGRFLDPAADKLLLVSAFVILPVLHILPLWVSVLVISRDIIIALGYLVIYLTWGSTQLSVRPLGKITTFFQLCCVALILLGQTWAPIHPAAHAWAIATAMVTLISGVDYLRLGILHANVLSAADQKRS